MLDKAWGWCYYGSVRGKQMTNQQYIRAVKATWDEPQDDDDEGAGDVRRDDLEGVGEYDDELR